MELPTVTLRGSCSCKRVRFTVDSDGPVPFQHCYCENCRKTGGCPSTNLLAKTSTLKIKGQAHIKVYRVQTKDTNTGENLESKLERRFCGECGTHLWASHPGWPDFVHPLASCIDTELPVPHQHYHIFASRTPSYVAVPPADKKNIVFTNYPTKDLYTWHHEYGCFYEDYFAKVNSKKKKN